MLIPVLTLLTVPAVLAPAIIVTFLVVAVPLLATASASVDNTNP